MGAPAHEPTVLPVGVAEVLREGKDVAILALGPLVYEALAAAEALARTGIEATVVNARFANPVDRDLVVRLAREVGRIVTVEEGCLAGGFGAAVCEILADAAVHTAAIRRLGVPDRFMPHGQTERLRAECGLDRAGIEAACREILS